MPFCYFPFFYSSAMFSVLVKAVDASRWVKNRAVQLNLFESERSRSNAFHLRTAVISTYVYIVLLTLAVTILVVCSSLGDQTQTITICRPSQEVYEDLHRKYSTTLSCGCRRMAISFDAFISVTPAYHPICSSVFVSDTWINLLFNSNIGYYIQIDFRSSASGQFQLLSSLCSLSRRTVRDALDEFLLNTLRSVNVLSPQSFQIQSKAQSSFVRRSSADAVHRLLRLIRDTTHNNRLQPGLQTTSMNSLYIYPNGVVASGKLDGCFIEINGSRCCCNFRSNCSSPSGFFDLYAYETEGIYVSPTLPMANISGFVAGCYAIESLLQSTLECLFDQACLKTLLRFFPNSTITEMDALLANETRFSPKTPIETLINELFLEEWLTVSSFAAYYSQCAPISCTHAVLRRNNAVYVLLTLTSLYGGLTVVLRLCVPRIIGGWRKRFSRSTEANPGRFPCCGKHDGAVSFFSSYFSKRSPSISMAMRASEDCSMEPI